MKPFRDDDLLAQVFRWGFAAAVCAAGLSATALPPGERAAPSEEAVTPFESHRRSPLHVKGVRLNFPETLRVKNGAADLSPIIQELRRAAETHYGVNMFRLFAFTSNLTENEIKNLCGQIKNSEKCWRGALTALKEAEDEIRQKMAGRILYPASYRPLGEGIEDRDFQPAIRDLKCARHCGSFDISYAVTDGSPEQYQELRENLKSRSKLCLQNVLGAVAKDIQDYEFPRPCLEERNKEHPVCKNMRKDISLLQDRIADIEELMGGPQSSQKTVAQSVCLNCVLDSQSEKTVPFFEMKAAVEGTRRQSQCFDLSRGEEKEVRPVNGFASPYIVRRDEKGDYSIVFSLEFSVAQDYDGPVPAEKVPDHYREKVQECLTEANQKMLGPKGEKLKISITEPPSRDWKRKGGKCPNTTPRRIAIVSADHRSSIQKYASDIDCPTITHEILHLTGLCDEYQEKKWGFYIDPETGEIVGANFGQNQKEAADPAAHDFKPAFDCRVIATNSIMSDYRTRWMAVFEEGQAESLLTAGQFQSILYGGCPEKNKRFNECSQLAYKSSQEEKEDCQELKSRCEKDNALGLNKQEELRELQEEIATAEWEKENFLKSRKFHKNTGTLHQTRREDYERDIEELEEEIQEHKTELNKASSQEDISMRENIIKRLVSYRKFLLTSQKIDEEKGILDQTHEERIAIGLNSTESRLRDLAERLKIVQSWPDPSPPPDPPPKGPH